MEDFDYKFFLSLPLAAVHLIKDITYIYTSIKVLCSIHNRLLLVQVIMDIETSKEIEDNVEDTEGSKIVSKYLHLKQ